MLYEASYNNIGCFSSQLYIYMASTNMANANDCSFWYSEEMKSTLHDDDENSNGNEEMHK